MIIVANKSGQLANRLFLFAHLVAFAMEHNLTIVNLSFDDYCEHFEHISRDLFCRFPGKKSMFSPTAERRHWVYETVSLWTSRFSGHKWLIPKGVTLIETDLSVVCYMNEPDFQSVVSGNRLIVIRGWRFRDLISFQKYADIIRGFFAPNSIIQQNVSRLIQSCRQEAEVIVGVHIRRGDYKEFMNGKYFFEIDDYKKNMRDVQKLFPKQKVLFLICSNETLNHEDFQEFHFRFGNNHIVEDLYSFAECDYIIGPPSTFTMWASFYGKVPLYKINDLNDTISRDRFLVADGKCDLPEDLAECSVWGQIDPQHSLAFR